MAKLSSSMNIHISDRRGAALPLTWKSFSYRSQGGIQTEEDIPLAVYIRTPMQALASLHHGKTLSGMMLFDERCDVAHVSFDDAMPLSVAMGSFYFDRRC